jgi:TrfA protein
VSISKGQQKVFWGSLLPRGYGRPDSGEYEVEITRELIALFDRGVTQVDWEQRRKLRRKPLAQWLHIDYAGHAKPFPVSISFLHEKAGSTTKSLRKFKQLVKAALNEIEGIGAIEKWHIDETDKVHIIRTPSPSQQRFLARAK